jgi:glycosyltransferase involved in cell wall biosynthesis
MDARQDQVADKGEQSAMKGPDRQTPLITLFASGSTGGIVRTSLRLANGFYAMGLNVDFIPNKPEFPYSGELDPGVGVRHLPTFHRVTGVPALARYIRDRAPTVILTGVYQHAVLALKARAVARSEARVFAAVRNPYSLEWAPVSRGKYSSRIRRLKKYYPRLNGIIANSGGVAEDFSRITGIDRSRITVIHNPAYDPAIEGMMEEPPDHPWFENGEPPVILNVGRLEPQKNLTMLMDAFEQVRDRLPCRLVLIGEGSLEEELRARAGASRHAGDIELLGHRANPFPCMHRSGAFVLSSLWEGFGNVLVEALAAGTPVVATDCPGGPGEILKGGRYGRLVPVGDAKKMADAIIRTLDDPPPEGELRSAAQRFRVDVIARRYLDFFGLSEPTGAG